MLINTHPPLKILVVSYPWKITKFLVGDYKDVVKDVYIAMVKNLDGGNIDTFDEFSEIQQYFYSKHYATLSPNICAGIITYRKSGKFNVKKISYMYLEMKI